MKTFIGIILLCILCGCEQSKNEADYYYKTGLTNFRNMEYYSAFTNFKNVVTLYPNNVSAKPAKAKIQEIDNIFHQFLIKHKNSNKYKIDPQFHLSKTNYLGDFTHFFQRDGDKSHFIRVGIIVSYSENDSRKIEDELKKYRYKVDDEINAIFCGKTEKKLNSYESIQNLKLEIRKHLNKILKTGQIEEVYFNTINFF